MNFQNKLQIEVELLLNRVKHVGQNTCVTTTLLEGEKGAGKTFLTTIIAQLFCEKNWQDSYLFYQCHEGTSPAHFLYDIDVQGVVEAITGNKDNIYLQEWVKVAVQSELKMDGVTKERAEKKIEKYSLNSQATLSKGILVQVCEKSKHQKVVLVIDELDKTSRAVDAFLLDFLQNFRVNDPIHGKIQGKKENCIVVFTSNAERLFSDPLYRRMVTIHIDYPTPIETFKRVKTNINTVFSDEFIKETIKFVEFVRTLNLFYKPVLSEIMTLLVDLEKLKNRSKEELLYFVCRTLSPDLNDRELIVSKNETTEFIKLIQKK